MNKPIALLLSVLLSTAGLGAAQAADPQPAPGPAMTPPSAAMALALTTCVFRDGRQVTGFLAGVDDHSIYLRRGGGIEACRVADLALIQIDRERKGGTGILAGALAGWYGVSLSLGGRPFGYTGGLWNGGFWTFLAVAAGAGLGAAIAPPGPGDSRMIDLSGPPEAGRRAWLRLRERILGHPAAARVSLRIAGGSVRTDVTRRFRESLPSGWVSYGYESPESSSSLNICRRVEIVLSLSRRWDVGIAGVLLGQPGMEGYFDSPGPGPYQSSYGHFSESFSGIGYFAVADWHPLKGVLPEAVDLRLGGGPGLAHTEFRFDGYKAVPAPTPAYYYAIQDVEDSLSERGDRLAGLVRASLDLRLTAGLALGLTADYVVAAPFEVPASAVLGTPARRIPLGSPSFGLNAVLRF